MSLTANYAITYDEALSIGILKNGTWPYATNKCLTRNDCQNYLFCNNSYLTGYGFEQLVKYQDVVSAATETMDFRARIRTNVGTNIVGFWYKYGGNDWTRWQITSISTAPSYTRLSALTAPTSEILYLACRNAAGTNLVFGTGASGGYAGYCGTSAPYSITPGGQLIYFNIDTTGTGGTLKTC